MDTIRYADPRRCPDCRATIEPENAACASCGLTLTGTLAARLFSTLSVADDLLRQLRASSGTAAAHTAAEPSATGPVQPAAPGPAVPLLMPPPAPAATGARLSALSVQKVLLGLGAGCVLVAALVFLAVTWSVLGVAGRTAVLLAFTAGGAGLCVVLARRGLRGAVEALALVTLGLLALDLFGARNAGWFGPITGPGFALLLGTVVVAAAGALTFTTTRGGGRPLVGAQAGAAVGVAVTCAGVAGLDHLPTAPALVLAVLVAAAATGLAYRLRLRVAAVGTAAAAAVAWLGLTGYAADRAIDHATLRGLWVEANAWPLVVAALLVAAIGALRRLPWEGRRGTTRGRRGMTRWRVGAVAVGYLIGAAVLALPWHDGTPDQLVGVALVALVVTGASAWLLKRRWAWSGVLVQGCATVGAAAGLVLLVAESAGRLGQVAVPTWAGPVSDRLPATAASLDQTMLPSPWMLPLLVVALAGTGVAVATRLPGTAYDLGWLRSPPGVTTLLAGSAVSLVLTLALYPVPVWLLVLLPLASAAGFLVRWWYDEGKAALVSAGVLAALAVPASLHATWLTLPMALVVTIGASLVQLRSRSVEVSTVAGALAAATLGGAGWTLGRLVDAPGTWVAFGTLVLLSAVVLALPLAPAIWWRGGAAVASRTGVDTGAAAAALPLALAGVVSAPADQLATWTAVYLTVAGVAVTAMSLLRNDRRMLGWPGGALLALASWVRLADIGVHQPEAYTLPSAAALLVVGLHHLWRQPRASTLSPLSAGLSLALVPSLLWVLVDSTGLRPLLLGLACLALVLAGVRMRWSAPILFGAGVGAALLVRFAAPYGESVPHWALIGAAGALLLGVGVTWERRLSEARQLVGYVRALR
ncbi:MAG TPA: hypothetical protein VFJ19_07570 [Nocardioidaceae bacterium]|nr:hypothetical protein [Nocardioidaceae bacterium]